MKKALITVIAVLVGTFLYAQNRPEEDKRIAFGTFQNGLQTLEHCLDFIGSGSLKQRGLG